MEFWKLITPQDRNIGATGAHMSKPSTMSLFYKKPAREVSLATTGLIDRVRRGYYRNVKRVTVHTPQFALSAISKTIQLEGGARPIYRGENN